MIFTLLIIALIGAIILTVIMLVGKRIPKPLNKSYFTKEWRYLQAMCGNKDTWPLAIINADKLLDTALKRRRFSGKTMGERMVSAQKKFSNNDSVWFAHKLRNRLVHEQDVNLREKDVKEALIGFRQALKDLGAL